MVQGLVDKDNYRGLVICPFMTNGSVLLAVNLTRRLIFFIFADPKLF